MKYQSFISVEDSRGLNRSKKHAIAILSGNNKFDIHNIRVGKTRKVALCCGDELLHIISRQVYQQYITPELSFV